MRLNAATSLIKRAVVPTGRPMATRASSTLAVRRPIFPTLRHSESLLPNIDRMFQEMDEMVESSFARVSHRPSLTPLGRDLHWELSPHRTFGFDINQDENEFKVAVHVPHTEAGNLDLRLDRNGRVLRIKGNKAYKEGGMQVQSRFEKAILLSPDVDTTKLTASMSGDTLRIVAPKLERKTAQDGDGSRKIEIMASEPDAAPQQGGSERADDTNEESVEISAEDAKIENVDPKQTVEV